MQIRNFSCLICSCTVLVIYIFVMSACANQNDVQVQSDEGYFAGIESWRDQRIAALKRPRGWVSLVGLHWLREGDLSFGSGESMDLRLPENAPANLGTWHLNGDSVVFDVTEGLVVVNVNDSTQFSDGLVRADSDEHPHLFNYGSFYWMVIQRADKYGVRIWDTLHAARTELNSVPHFKVDPVWALPAQFSPAPPGTQMVVDNEVGLEVAVDIAGTVSGTIGQESFNLVAFDGGPDQLFLIFADMTTDITTYSGGRYLYIPRGDADGNTVLDFNKSYNPPCVFTDFATCLLPPEENFIPFKVTAGEKMPAYR